MCYVLDFEFDDSYKACKFTAFPRTFQIINYLFFKEVDNGNNYRVLSLCLMLYNKKSRHCCRLYVVNVWTGYLSFIYDSRNSEYSLC